MSSLFSEVRTKEIKEPDVLYTMKSKNQLKGKLDFKQKRLFEQRADFSPTASPTKRQFSLTDYPSRANILVRAGDEGVKLITGQETSIKRKERSWDDDDSGTAISTVREIHVMPPTPRKKKFKVEPISSDAVRPDPLLSVIESLGAPLEVEIVEDAHNPIQRLQGMISRRLKGDLYKLPSGQIVPVIQQPIQEKPTCGPGCVLMLALSAMENLIHSDDFWSWYGGTRLANSTSLINAFRLLSIEAKICRLTSASKAPNLDDSINHKILDPKDAVATVKDAIHNTRNPVILAITHPILKGHWIIVDGFENGCAFIRDPFTAMAFALPEETLSKWLLEKDPIQDMIYFPA